MITSQAATTAVEQHGTIWFDANLNPVTPCVGQWFCEFDEYDDETLLDGAFVCYEGESFEHVSCGDQLVPVMRQTVSTEDGDVRPPRGVLLIRQA